MDRQTHIRCIIFRYSTIHTLPPSIIHRKTHGAALANPDRLWPEGKLYFAFDPISLGNTSRTNRRMRELVTESMDSIRDKVRFLSAVQCYSHQ